jgi:hypothetical protein
MTNAAWCARRELRKPANRCTQSLLLRGDDKARRSEHLTTIIPHRQRAIASPNAVGQAIEEKLLLTVAFRIQAKLQRGRSGIDDKNRCIRHDGFLDSIHSMWATPTQRIRTGAASYRL